MKQNYNAICVITRRGGICQIQNRFYTKTLSVFEYLERVQVQTVEFIP